MKSDARLKLSWPANRAYWSGVYRGMADAAMNQARQWRRQGNAEMVAFFVRAARDHNRSSIQLGREAQEAA